MSRYVADTKTQMWITKPILRARGWTDTAIRRFLPDAEAFKPNPGKSPMPVWTPETVASAEASPEWVAWRGKSRANAYLNHEGGDERFTAKCAAADDAIRAARLKLDRPPG